MTPIVIKDMRLSDLITGEEGIITRVYGHGAFRKRITEMGFVKGKKVKVIRNAPLLDPVEYEIMGYNVSLRRSEASLVEVLAAHEEDESIRTKFEGTIDEEGMKLSAGEKINTISVALVGNPNSGKTTLYNHASGSHEKVGNYGGVTIDAREATFHQEGYSFRIVDLPGTYSITEYTPEELFVRMHITDKSPDVVVNVVDGSNLERNLYLTTQLIDMNIKVVIALNMYDELEATGAKIDCEALGRLIGIPVIPTVASKGHGISELFRRIIEVYEDRDPVVRHIHINYGGNIEAAILKIKTLIKQNPGISDRFSSRYLAVKLLESDKTTLNQLAECSNFEEIRETAEKVITQLEKESGEKSETMITDAKYGFIAGALYETMTPGVEVTRRRTSDIDFFLTHRLLGFPLFIFFMWVMFQATFTIGSYPMNWINDGVGWFGQMINNYMPDGAIRDLVAGGIIGGVGGVIVFLPNILILFFFISFMEDTGYMARVSFIMDKLMHRIGLHGKSFIPMLMGFGCNVPAIMATRTLENRKDRILTMMMIPFMSCSARLPVYVLLISAFFPHYQGLVLISVYVIGVLIAVVVALATKKIMFSKQDIPFVMELPPYRMPTLRNTSVHMWHKGVQYLRKMGTVILFASVLIWALGYFPHDIKFSSDWDKQISTLNSDLSLTDMQRKQQVHRLELAREAERQEKSWIGRMGHFIEPALIPLGFDWKIGVSIITGMAAKEIVIGTMGVLYQTDYSAGDDAGGMKNRMQQQVHTHGELKGQKVFTPLVACTLMLFVLIYFPCIAVIAAIKKEANWKWAVFTMFYTTALAWIVAFVAYQAGSLFV